MSTFQRFPPFGKRYITWRPRVRKSGNSFSIFTCLCSPSCIQIVPEGCSVRWKWLADILNLLQLLFQLLRFHINLWVWRNSVPHFFPKRLVSRTLGRILTKTSYSGHLYNESSEFVPSYCVLYYSKQLRKTQDTHVVAVELANLVAWTLDKSISHGRFSQPDWIWTSILIYGWMHVIFKA